MEKKPVTIEISRPTGPRIIPGPPKQMGFLERYVPRRALSRGVQGAIAVASVVRRPRVIAAGSTIALAIVAHLAVSSINAGFSQLAAFWSFAASNKAAMDPQAVSYTGPGDAVANAVLFYSCARAINTA